MPPLRTGGIAAKSGGDLRKSGAFPYIDGRSPEESRGGAIGVFITLEKSTSHMTDEAASAGFFTSEHFGKFPRIQILTIEDLLVGKTLQMPPSLERTFKQAERVTTESTDQRQLGFD